MAAFHYQRCNKGQFHFSFDLSYIFLPTGVWAQIQMPQTSMDVIEGRMVVLRATYSTASNIDLSTNTIIWNFVSNNSMLVRTKILAFLIHICFNGVHPAQR